MKALVETQEPFFYVACCVDAENSNTLVEQTFARLEQETNGAAAVWFAQQGGRRDSGLQNR
ncbi:MAG: hypothetical protein RIE73_27870 [Coleofasciculus sp. C1-SOL-03]|uniref:hypothetical protein n=1 Tax=Coleofasciculus sp. C1-SOL-03 TaxID=3069522 RepID=UPI0032F5EE93